MIKIFFKDDPTEKEKEVALKNGIKIYKVVYSKSKFIDEVEVLDKLPTPRAKAKKAD